MTSRIHCLERDARRSWILAMIALFCLTTFAGRQASAKDSADEDLFFGASGLVEKTFNADPFRVEVKKTATRSGYRIYRLT